jgi:hypothetical protein
LYSILAGNTNWGGRLSTVDQLIKVACFVKKVNNIFNIKRNWSKLVQGGQLYWAFPFSNASLILVISCILTSFKELPWPWITFPETESFKRVTFHPLSGWPDWAIQEPTLEWCNWKVLQSGWFQPYPQTLD